MKATTERIFANDIQMMLWQEKNCCECAKAISTSTATVYRCALQRDMECQQRGLLEINERSVRLLKGVDVCPLMKPREAIVPCVDETVIDAHEFAKGKPVERPRQEEAPRPSPKQPMKGALDGYSEAEIKAAEARVLDAIWRKEIAPNIGKASKKEEASMSEARFKELTRQDARNMLDTFTWDENMMIAFVPLIISKVAWVYAEKALRYCADHRISEFKKLGRQVKELRQKYLDVLRLDLDFTHIHRIESQTLQFMDECDYDLAILWYQVNQYIKSKAPDMPLDMMRTDAAVAVLMVRFMKAHNKRMDALIAAKMGESQSIDNPQMIALEKLMMQYFPADFKLETNANLDLCGKIFANNLSKIEFEVTDDKKPGICITKEDFTR